MTQEYLFIGGPADGKRIKIHEGKNEYCIPKYEPISYSARGFDPTELSFQVVRYRRRYLTSGSGSRYCVFAEESLLEIEVIGLLVEGYNPQNK